MKDPIGLIFRDYWTRRRRLHISAFGISLFFSQMLYLAFFNVLAAIGVVVDGGQILILCTLSLQFLGIFSVLIILGLIPIVLRERLRPIFVPILMDTWSQIFQRGEQNRRETLLVNFTTSTIIIIRRLSTMILIYVFYSILTIISLPFGFIAYTFFSTWFAGKTLEGLILFRLFAVPFEPFFVALFELSRAVAEYLLLVPPAIRASALIVIALLCIPLADFIEADYYKLQPVSVRKRLSNGVILVLKHLALPISVSNALFYGVAGLFDHRDTALDIHVVNDRNVDQAFEDVLRTDQDAFVARFSVTPEEIVGEFLSSPTAILRIAEILNKTYPLETFLTHFLQFMRRVQLLKKLRLVRISESVREAEKPRFIFGIGANGTVCYGIIEAGPNTRLSRFIKMIWCNDVHVKDEIVRRIIEYESD